MRRAALALLLLVALPLRAEPFRFPQIGLAIEGPEGWQVLTGAEYTARAARYDLGSADLNALARDGADLPFLSLVRHPDPFVGVNPGLHVLLKPGRVTADAALREVAGWMAGQARDFILIGGPEPQRIAGTDAGWIRYAYTLGNSAGQPTRIEEKLWIVPLSDRFLVISSGVAPDDDSGARAEIEAAVASLHRIPGRE